MRNDIHAIFASYHTEEQARLLSHEELLKAYCDLIKAFRQAVQENVALRAQVFEQQQQIADLQKSFMELQQTLFVLMRKLNVNSDTSGIPPSQDPFRNERHAAEDRKEQEEQKSDDDNDTPADGSDSSAEGSSETSADKEKKSGRKVGGKPGHRGSRQRMVQPDEVMNVLPSRCSCGCTEFDELTPFYLHQHLEIPQILALVKHFLLHKGTCTQCGREVKAKVPTEYSTGYGPNFSAFAMFLATLGMSRRGILELFTDKGFFMTSHGEGIPLSHGGLNKIFMRGSNALAPHHAQIGEVARSASYNYIDETSWRIFGPPGAARHWIWVMTSPGLVTWLNIYPHRNKAAFLELVGPWTGILISDDYSLYCSWPEELRQSCMSHLLRAAKKLINDPDPEIARGGTLLYKELCRLTKTDKTMLTEGEWRALRMRLKGLLNKFKTQDNVLGTLASRLHKEWISLYTFLRYEEVEPTNNRAEQALRPAVTRRKSAFGCTSEKGLRWTERILSCWQTCRVQGWSYFELLRNAMGNFLRGVPQDLSIYEALLQRAQEARAKLGLDDIPAPTTA